MNLTNEQFLEICLELEEYHAVFYQLWNMGKPVFTDSIKTAAVCFDPQGQWVEFVFNPGFWKKLNPYQRKFVICHECLHVILNHGSRAGGASGINQDAVNSCLDVVINESLVRSFGFDRKQLGDYINKECCWVNTVFPKRNDVPTDAAFEHYLNQLPKVNIPGYIKSLLNSIDDHTGIGGTVWDDVIKDLDGSLSSEEKESLKDFIKGNYQEGQDGENKRAGDGVGGWSFVKGGKVKRKKKWESVIKRWSRRYDRPELREVEQWARLNRRLAALQSDLMLPSEMELEHDAEGKIRVWFFQDTSGSCWHLKDRFFKAARSLDPSRFNVRMFCFDTKVVEIDIAKKKIYGGGGTSFHILERAIQEDRGKGKYPEAVFVITDGYGSTVSPEKPNRWYWFLTHDYRHYVPKESNVFMLNDFE